MALFKIAKGNSVDLESSRPNRQEGFIYLTQDDMKFHIDVESGTDAHYRRTLNASLADMLKAWNTDPRDTAGRWTVQIDDLQQEDLVDGLTIRVRLSTSYNGTFNTLNVNGFGPVVVYWKYNNRLTSHLGQYSEALLTYRTPHEEVINGTTYTIPGAAANDYVNNSVNYGKSGWVLDASYSDGNNYDRILNNYERRRTGAQITRYKLCMIDAKGQIQPVSIGDTTADTKTANTTPLLPTRIMYYSSGSAAAASSVTGAQTLYEAIPTTNIKYTINQDMPVYSDLYFVGTFNSDNLFVLDTNFYKIVSPPSTSEGTIAENTFTKGKYYLYVGSSYSSTNYFQLMPNHQLYYCDDDNGQKIYAVTQRPHYTRTTVGTLEWTSDSNEYLLTKGALANWNGAYSGTDSNIEYTKVGQLGSMATAQKSTWISSRVVYATATDKLETASKLYTTGSNLAVNTTELTNGYIFEVNGASKFGGDTLTTGTATHDNNIDIIFGDTDKFINWYYNTGKKAGASWRAGVLGTGSSDTNYFVIQSGTSTTSATTWNEALRIGQNTYDAGFGGNVYPLVTNTKSLGTSTLRWSAAYIGTQDTYGSTTTPIYWNAGVPAPIGMSFITGTTGRLAYYSSGTQISALSSTVGSATKGIYLNEGVPTEMTYSLNATVSAGTANKFAYYSDANTISAYEPTTTTNAVLYYSDTAGAIGQRPSANGALYATVGNGELKWGLLPIAQGGTGAATAAAARSNLAVPNIETDTYPTLLNHDGTNTWIKIGKANTSYGLLPSQSGAAGSGHNYLGTSSWYWKYAYIDEIHGTLVGNADTATDADTVDGYHAADLLDQFSGGVNKITIQVGGGTAQEATLVNSVVTEWNAGTTAGPTIVVKVNGVASSATAVPSAAIDASGIVTTDAQVFKGSKTFNDGMHIYGSINMAGSAATNMYSGGGVHSGHYNLVLHGDGSGVSGIGFTSQKAPASNNVTNINSPSDRAFIQYHAYGVTAKAEGTAPTLATSGEVGRFVIGVGNDSTDQLWLQSPGHTTLIHQIGVDSYVIPDTGNTTGQVGGINQPVYVSSGVLTGITCLSTAYGGTGVTSHTANRLVWSSSATQIQAADHYANATKIGINYTSEPDDNFYVNGTTYLKGNTTSEGNISPSTTDTYTLGTSNKVWQAVYATEFFGNLKYDELIPIETKTYTNVIATANDQNGAGFFYAKVRGTDYNTVWHTKFKVTAWVPGQPTYYAISIYDVWGAADTYMAYKCQNAIRSTSARPLYYNTLFRLKQAGYNAGLGDWVGFSLFYSNNPTNTNYKRTVKVELIEYENCTVEMQDTLVTPTNIPSRNTTNYTSTNTGYDNFDFCNNGLRETGDDTGNDTDRTLQALMYFRFTSGAAGIGRYTLLMEESTGVYSSLTTTFPTSGTPLTTLTMNTGVKYKPERIIYFNQNANRAANTNIANNTQYFIQYDLIDIRYTFQLTAGQITAYKPFYMVGTLDEDGLFTIDPAATAWTQTLPTTEDGKVYIFLGTVYNDTNPYRIALESQHPMYSYVNGALRVRLPGEALTADKWTTAQKVYVDLETASTTTTIQGGSSSAQVIGIDGVLGADHGGTGNSSYTANRMVYSESATKLSTTDHYASSTKLAINSTSEPTQNLYVNGTTYLNGTLYIKGNTTSEGNITPSSANAYTLGATDKAWKQIYGNEVYTNVANSDSAGGVSLYGTTITDYGIALRKETNVHGWICGATTANLAIAAANTGLDLNVVFYNSGSVNRGWKFIHGGSIVGSISGNGYASFNRLNLNRKGGAKNGRIYWYDTEVKSAPYYTWVTYMSDVTNGSAPTGGKPSSLGNVSSWAMRSLIENSTNYGWILESQANAIATATSATPLSRWAVSAVDGQMTITGDIFHATYNAAGTAITRTAAAIAFRLGDANGTGMYIGDGSLTVIGGGESSQYMADDTNQYRKRVVSSATNTLEEMWVMSDSHIRFITNANNLSAAQATWDGYTQTPSTSNKFYEVILDNRINFYPWITNYGSLGHSSYYWRSAYINGYGNIHWNNLAKLSVDTVVTTDTNRGLTRVLANQSDISLNGRGSKLWGLSPASVTLESTVDSGSTWTVHTKYTTDAHKRGVTNGTGTPVTVGDLTYDNGSSGTAAVVVGHGARITLDFQPEHRFGWIECLVASLNTRGHTCSFTIERWNKKSNTWTTIETGTLTNSNQNRVIYPAVTFYMNGNTSTSTASYCNKLRVTMIVTALGTAQRYAPTIQGIYGYGSGNPSHTRSATYPSGRLFDITTAQYGTPYYYNDRNSGAIIAPVYGWQVYGTGAWVAANTAAYADVTIGNGNKQVDAGQHAEGRLIIYAKGQYYHLLKGHDTVGGGHYTHTFSNATGEIVQCYAAANGNTDYQTAILFNQNKSNYPTSYGTVLVMAYRKASDNAKTDYANQLYIPTGDTATYNNTMFYRGSKAEAWNDWQMVAHATAKTAVGSETNPVYIDAAGLVTACTYSLSSTVNSSTANYMAYYSDATTIDGTENVQIIDGCLNLYPNNSSYREGMRIHPTGGWSDIILMGNTNTNTSGIAATDWFIGNNNGAFYITHNGSSSSSTGYLKASTENSAGYWQLYQRVGINGISNTYNLYVNGTSLLNGNTTIGTTTGGALGLAQTDGLGLGISLYGGPKAKGSLEYGIMFAKTATFGKLGSVSNDWATYFTMNRNDSRGWIFKSNGGAANTNNNVASIAGNGDFYTIGKATVCKKLYLGVCTTTAADDDSGIHVWDTRDVNHLPNTFGEKTVQWYFDNAAADAGRGDWSTIMHMRGHSGTFAAHQMSFNAAQNNNDGNIYHRSGYNNAWATWNVHMDDPSATVSTTVWRKLLDNVNIDEEGSPFRMTSIATTDLVLTQTWQDTGIAGDNIPETGSYIIQVFINSSTVNTLVQTNEYYTGFMSWFSGTCSNADAATGADEIQLHRAGQNNNDCHIYLRTIRVKNGTMKLQIKASKDTTVKTPVYFRFRRMI